MAHAGDGQGAAAHAHEPARDRNVDHHRAHERIARTDKQPPHQHELDETLRLTEADKAGAGNQTAGRHQPASAVAVHQRADHGRCRRADENLAGTDEREHTAGNAEVGGQRFEKYAQRAGDRKRRSDVGEKADDDDNPAVIERLSFRRLFEQRRDGHSQLVARIAAKLQARRLSVAWALDECCFTAMNSRLQ